MLVDLQTEASHAPEPGQLAIVRGRRWVVSDVIRSELPPDITADVPPLRQHLVSLVSVEDDATGEELTVIWELEPGASSIERPDLPMVDVDRIDDPRELDAFLDAIRWGAVASAGSHALQAPFRSGIVIEDYQLEPGAAARPPAIRERLERLPVVRHLDLDVDTDAAGEDAPWTALLGENGVGKSSVLEAVALALIGDDYRRELGVTAADFLRRRARTGQPSARRTSRRPAARRLIFSLRR